MILKKKTFLKEFHAEGNWYRPSGTEITWLVTESFTGDNKSWLICFDGNPIVNGKKLSRWDYAKLENKHYGVEINDGCIGVFTRIW